MNRLILLTAILLSLCAAQLSGRAQQINMWWDAAVSKKILPRTTVSLDLQWRYEFAGLYYSSLLPEITLDRALSKDWNGGISYRYQRKNAFRTDRQRAGIYLAYNAKKKRWTWEGRMKYQYDFQRNGENNESVIRYKMGLGYARKKWLLRPQIWAELFQNMLLKDRFVPVQYRTGINIKAPLHKHHLLNAGIFYSNGNSDDLSEAKLILEIGYKARL